MTSILKADTIQDTDGNNIINESGNTITIGASGDTTNIVGTLQNNGAAVGGTNTPAFEATKSDVQYGISLSTDVKITYETEIFDTAGNYASSRFTPTTAGKYFVYCGQRMITQSSGTLTRTKLTLYKNGSKYQNVVSDFNFTDNYTRAAGTFISATVDMNGSSDYLEVYGQIQNTDGQTGSTGFHRDNGSVFGAYKIIE